MSGGAFEYKQHHIRDIHESIQSELDGMGKKKHRNDLWQNREYYEKYPEEEFNPMETEEVIEIFKKAIEVLKTAEVYAQRIDWYMSGDDGEESLILRLKEDLKAI